MKTNKTKSKKPKKSSKKKKYKVRNWHEYNEILVNRGRLMVWVDEETQNNWQNNPKTGKAGAPKQYSDTAITTCLTFKALFHLTLRATEGFVTSLFQLMELDLPVPDFSTLSIRGATLDIDIRTSTDLDTEDETINIVVDSSGAKVYGEGEWKVKKHGWQKHRTWRKFHLGIDPQTRRIKAAEMTGNDTGDCEMLEALLKQITNPIDHMFGDGGYDKRVCYKVLDELGIVAGIPPQENAKIWQHGNCNSPPHARDENLRRIREIGRTAWKKEISYHQRSIVENGMFRFKTAFGERLSARNYANQRTEVLLKCKILNQLTDIGMPQTEVVA
jgi:hypothetical protein